MKVQAFALACILFNCFISPVAHAAKQRLQLPLVSITGLVGITGQSGCPGTIPMCPPEEPCPVITCHPYSEVEFKLPAGVCMHRERDFQVMISLRGDVQEMSIVQEPGNCKSSAFALPTLEQTLVLRTEKIDSGKLIKIMNPLQVQFGPLPQ